MCVKTPNAGVVGSDGEAARRKEVSYKVGWRSFDCRAEEGAERSRGEAEGGGEAGEGVMGEAVAEAAEAADGTATSS